MTKKELRKFLRNIEARVLPYSVLILMIVAGLTTMFFVLPPHELTVRGATTDQFSYNKQITLNSSQVPSTLTNFPVLINITDTDLRDNCLSSGWDIAFFNATNVQLNHEIELYNGTTGQLVAWVNVTTLAHDADTIIYMYYGDADIGASAENVAGTWDSSYLCVWHMYNSNATNVPDSKGTENGTKSGTVEVDGIIGKAQYFDGINDYINISGLTDSTQTYTISLWTYLDTITQTQTVGIDTKSPNPSTNRMVAGMCYFKHYHTYDGDMRNSTVKVIGGTWAYVTYTVTAGDFDLFINGSYAGGVAAWTASNINTETKIGSTHDATANWYNGTMDELRISKTVRSASWINTEYNTMKNASDGGFFTMDEAQGDEEQYQISGLDANTRFPFSGEAGDTVWSTDNITMNIYTNVSIVSENCTDIFIDFADIDADIVQENFSLAIINTTDGDWATISSVLQVSAVDGNMTFNATTWATGVGAGWAHGTNPFPIVGYNSTLAVRVRVSIPAGKATGTYTTDSWKVLWKVIT